MKIFLSRLQSLMWSVILLFFILFRKTNLFWALYLLEVMEHIFTPAIHRPCLQKVRCFQLFIQLVQFLHSFWDSRICTIILSCFLSTCLCKSLVKLHVSLLCPQPLLGTHRCRRRIYIRAIGLILTHMQLLSHD